MEETFWNCWVEGTNGGIYHKHALYHEAEREAERLAQLNMGRKVYIMESMGYCIIPKAPIEWHQIREVK